MEWICPSVTARLSAWSANRVAESRPSESASSAFSNRPQKGSFQRNGSYRYVAIVLATTGRISRWFSRTAESLDARMSVGELISEPMVIQKIGTREKGPSGRGTSRIGRSSQKRRPESFLRVFGRSASAYWHCRALAVSPDLWFWTNPYRRWTYRFKVRSSTCSWICKTNWG